MQLRHWQRGNIERIYVDGLPGTTGQVYVYVSRGRLELSGEGMRESPSVLLASLAQHVGMPTGALGQLLFAALKASAQQPNPRQSARSLAPASRAYVPVGVTPFGRDLCFENISNPLEVEVEIDHREPDELDALIAQAPNTKVTRAHLPVGDFRINGGRVLVERKTVRDFALSVQSGHVFDQAERIGFEPNTVGFVFIEGDVFRGETGMLASAITGAITCLSLVQGLSVINTMDLRHTAFFICKIAQHERNGLGYELPLRKDKPTLLLDAQRFVLEGINGVNPVLAGGLLEHFGSVRAVAAADEQALRQVKGIGPKTAARIVEVMSRPYGSA